MSVSFSPHAKVDLTVEFEKPDSVKLPIHIRKTEAVIYGLAIKYLGTLPGEGERFQISLQHPQDSSNILTMHTASMDMRRFDVEVIDGLIRILATGETVCSAVYFNPARAELQDELHSNEERIQLPQEIKNLVQKARARDFNRGQLPLKKILAGSDVVVLFCSDDRTNHAIHVARKTDREFFECMAWHGNDCGCPKGLWIVQLPNESGSHDLKFTGLHNGCAAAVWDREELYEQKL